MREFKKRRNGKGELLHFLFRCAGALVLLGVTALAVRGAWDMYGRLRAASLAEEETQRQLHSLQAQKVQLQTSVAELSSPRGTEAEIRERFGVVRPGEGVVQIVRDSKEATSSADAGGGWFGHVLHALFDW